MQLTLGQPSEIGPSPKRRTPDLQPHYSPTMNWRKEP